MFILFCSERSLLSQEVAREVLVARIHRVKILPVWLTEPKSVENQLGRIVKSLQNILTHGRPPADWLSEIDRSLATLTPVPTEAPTAKPPVPERRAVEPVDPIEASGDPPWIRSSQEARFQQEQQKAELCGKGFAELLRESCWKLVPRGRTIVSASSGCSSGPDLSPRVLINRRPFLMEDFPLTRDQLREILLEKAIRIPENPLSFDRAFGYGQRVEDGPGLPATGMSGTEAHKLCDIRSALDGGIYRMPTDVEWEFAARAGCGMDWPFEFDHKSIHHFAVFNVRECAARSSDRQNPFGLVDMMGNVWEWTTTLSSGQDEHSDFENGARFIRGGSFRSKSIKELEFSFRDWKNISHREDDLGVRMVRELRLSQSSSDHRGYHDR
jgi:hypothetical protein